MADQAPYEHYRLFASGMLSPTVYYWLFVSGPISERELEFLINKLQIDRRILLGKSKEGEKNETDRQDK